MFIFPLFYLKKHENNYVFEGLLYDFQISESPWGVGGTTAAGGAGRGGAGRDVVAIIVS